MKLPPPPTFTYHHGSESDTGVRVIQIAPFGRTIVCVDLYTLWRVGQGPSDYLVKDGRVTCYSIILFEFVSNFFVRIKTNMSRIIVKFSLHHK